MRRLIALLASLLAGPALAQTPPPAPPAPPVALMGAMPGAEDAFIKAIEDARQSYTNGINDMVRGIARPRRAEALCRAVPRGRVALGCPSRRAARPGS